VFGGVRVAGGLGTFASVDDGEVRSLTACSTLETGGKVFRWISKSVRITETLSTLFVVCVLDCCGNFLVIEPSPAYQLYEERTNLSVFASTLGTRFVELQLFVSSS
jgi:hypothetical protein